MDEAALHKLLSGDRKDVFAHGIRGGLRLGSWAYAAAVGLRNLGYDSGCLKIHRASVPVISIGNITTGGTGKTPFAAWLANWLTRAGRKPALLSRGYRSLDRDLESGTKGNDEKRVLDRLCPTVPHLQQKDRVSSAVRAVKEFACDLLLLDDGFQHRRLFRDLDLVLVDSVQPWGYGHLLPRGLLRESLHGLKRADVIILTRADQCTHEQRQSLLAELRRIRNSDECAQIAFTPQRLVDQYWDSHLLSSIAGKKASAFCGIGNPEAFRRTIASLTVSCESMQAFPDHHHYDKRELAQIARRANELASEIVLTTQKDLVKIATDDWNGPPLYAIEIGVEFISGLELLESQLRQIIAGRT